MGIDEGPFHAGLRHRRAQPAHVCRRLRAFRHLVRVGDHHGSLFGVCRKRADRGGGRPFGAILCLVLVGRLFRQVALPPEHSDLQRFFRLRYSRSAEFISAIFIPVLFRMDRLGADGGHHHSWQSPALRLLRGLWCARLSW